MKTVFLLLNLLLLLPVSARVSMDVRPREFTTDDTATLTLRIQGGVDGTPNLSLPDGISIVGTSRNEVIINRSRETTFNFTVQASQPGEYIIGPFSMNLEGRTHAVEAIPVTVKQAEVVRSSEELLAQLHLSRSRALVQQALTVTATLYSLHQIEDVQLMDFDTSGLEVSNWQGERIQDRIIDGQRYRGVRFAARVTPTRSGEFRFEPVFRVTILEPEEDLTRGRMGMFTRNVRRRQLRIQPEAVFFEARHPPSEGRPHDFDGAIGSFTFQASASPNALNVGEPITLRTAINGAGNIRTLLPPSMEESDDFRVFTPRLVEEDLARDLQSGRKVIEQVIIPRHAEVTEVPEMRFSFFDPDRWEYVTRTAGPFPLEVAPAPEGTTTFLPGSGALRLSVGPTLLGEDLVYLKNAPGTFHSLRGMSPAVFSFWSSLPVAAWALFGWTHKRKQALRDNPKLAHKRNAPRKLRRDLDALRNTDAAAIHEAIWRCLADYLGHRFQIPPGDVQSGALTPHLQDKLKPETLHTLDAWLRRCERARFAGPTDTDTGSLAREFETVMLSLDREAS
jgi:hypothetical protein